MNLLRALFRRLGGRGTEGNAPPGGNGEALSYERSRELAGHEDPEVRRMLAARSDVRPEILYYLSDDPHPGVRREIAGNHATPPHADLKLARDSDPEVRGHLAQKIAKLAPNLTDDERCRLHRLTRETLELLARDQITRVRQILAETLKDVAHAPPEVIRRLAHDSELVVAGPVLESSPVLTDEDLLDIIRGYPASGALSAISRRRPLLSNVADAVIDSDDVQAIAVLLANDSAQIREETLDRLIDRAALTEIWHAPLVRRPNLSSRAVMRLASFVADSLLQTLTERTELDEPTRREVVREVHRRIEADGRDLAGIRKDTPPAPPENRSPAKTALAVSRAQDLEQKGLLNEKAVLSALAEGDIPLVKEGLRRLSGASEAMLLRIVDTRSAKGVMALAWKAGFSATTASQLQSALTRLPPSSILPPRATDGGYPLIPEELLWQLDFFRAMCGEEEEKPAP